MRRAYTLIELLIVVTIVVILVAAILPVAKMILDNQRQSEAGRQLNTHFALARATAARNNRPAGVWLEYDAPIGAAPGVSQCTRIYLAEVAAPYAGGTTAIRATMRVDDGVAQFLPLVPVVYVGDLDGDGFMDDDLNHDHVPDPADQNPADSKVDVDVGENALLLSLIEPGERFEVRFDFKGVWFICQRNTADQLVFLGTNTSGASMSPPRYDDRTSPGYRFQVTRQPRRVGQALEFSNGICIDVEYSGFGAIGTDFGTPTKRAVVMFDPSGGVKEVFLDSTPIVPFGPLHFLIGSVTKVGEPIDASRGSNLADSNAYWVSVGRQHGDVTTSENMPLAGHNDWSAQGQVQFVAECREAATAREQRGGQ